MRLGWKHRNSPDENWYKPAEVKKLNFNRAQTYSLEEVLVSGREYLEMILARILQTIAPVS